MDQHAFLSLLHTGVGGTERFCLVALPSRAHEWITLDQQDAIATFAARYSDQNLYTSIASFTPTAEEGYARKKQQAVTVGALYVDIDFKETPEETARGLLTILPPSVVIHTGGGLHCYWLLRERVPADAAFETILKRLAHFFKADKAAAETARVLRLAGSTNFKYTPARPVVIETADGERRFQLSDFETIPGGTTPAAAAPSGKNPRGWADAFVGGTSEERNTHAWKMLNRWRCLGLTEAEIRAWAEMYAQRSQYDTEEYEKLEDQLTRLFSTNPAHEPQDDTGADGTADVTSFEQSLLTEKTGTALLRTGFAQLDHHLQGGFTPGALVYLTGMSGVGKSALGVQIAWQVAKAGQEVLYLSLEMPRQEQLVRCYAQMSRVTVRQYLAMLYGESNASPEQQRMVRSLSSSFRALPLKIVDSIYTMEQIERSVSVRPNLKLLVIDQLQHIAPPNGAAPGRHAIEAISRRLVQLTGKYHVTVLAMSQVNRPSPEDQKKALWLPTAWNLRESEQLRHDAHGLIILARDLQSDPRTLHVQVEKNRMGGNGPWFQMGYVPEQTRVEDRRA